MKPTRLWTAMSCGLLSVATVFAAQPPDGIDVPRLVGKINQVGPQGAGHREAIDAWRQLAGADAGRLPEILGEMDESNRLARNWLRAVVEAIAQRTLDGGGRLPQAELEDFLADKSAPPHARRLAYELVLQVDPAAEQRLVPGLVNDPSMELRRDGIAYALSRAKELLDRGKRAEAAEAYRQTLTAARDLDQINEAAEQLRALGRAVDLPRHFGFLLNWKLVGPFDNTDKGGFDVVYGPELDPDPAGAYEGKSGTIKWFEHTTDDPYGTVDLNRVLGKYKGAIAYARAEFYAEREGYAEFRLGCINGNKLWLNGDLLTSNHIYHAGTHIDQYTATGRLKKGKNVILLKIAQNEQTEPWAQRWQFQLRVCDQYGTAILSQDPQP
jgi:hypothetical protein